MQISGFNGFKSRSKSMFVPLKISVLCISDTRTIENDISGDLLVNKIAETGHTLLNRSLCQDSIYAVRAIVSNWIADKECQVIITKSI